MESISFLLSSESFGENGLHVREKAKFRKIKMHLYT